MSRRPKVSREEAERVGELARIARYLDQGLARVAPEYGLPLVACSGCGRECAPIGAGKHLGCMRANELAEWLLLTAEVELGQVADARLEARRNGAV